MTVWQFEGFSWDDRRTIAVAASGKDIYLTTQQRRLLKILLQAPGQSVSAEWLCEQLVRFSSRDPMHALEQCISNLWSNLQNAGVTTKPIEGSPTSPGYRILMVGSDVDVNPNQVQDPWLTGSYLPDIAGRVQSKTERPLHVDPMDAAAWLQQRRDSGLEQRVGRPPSSEAIARVVERYRAPQFEESLRRLDGEILGLGRESSGLPHRYPVAVFPNRIGQSLESVLPLRAVDARVSAIADPNDMAILDPVPRMRRWLAVNPDSTAFDAHEQTASGWNLCMTEISRNDGALELRARLGAYGTILDTCDALIDEVVDHPLGPWPLRDHFESLEPNPLLSAQRRAAGIGVAALITVVERGSDGQPTLKALLSRRSKLVGTYANARHVAPAGMLNWRYGDGPHESRSEPWLGYEPEDVLRSVLNEYAEELRNIEDMQENANRARIDGLPAIVQLKRRARIEFTGIALDLMNLRPEICVLFYIGDPDWDGPARFQLNYEYEAAPSPAFRRTNAQRRRRARRRQLTPITVATTRHALDEVAARELAPAETVPSGAAAFWLGVRRARQLFAAEHGA